MILIMFIELIKINYSTSFVKLKTLQKIWTQAPGKPWKVSPTKTASLKLVSSQIDPSFKFAVFLVRPSLKEILVPIPVTSQFTLPPNSLISQIRPLFKVAFFSVQQSSWFCLLSGVFTLLLQEFFLVPWLNFSVQSQ